MYHERLITGVAATLGAIAVVLAVVGVTGSPVALPVALAFAASAALMYDQLSGRMAARVYRRVERHARVERGGDGRGVDDAGPRRERSGPRSDRRRRAARDGGAGPREEWTPPRDGRSARQAADARRGRRQGARERGAGGATGPGGPGPTGNPPTDVEAYRTLGLDPGADDETVTDAYRERVKEVHPDTDGGDEEQFMAVKEAYEQLTD